MKIISKDSVKTVQPEQLNTGPPKRPQRKEGKLTVISQPATHKAFNNKNSRNKPSKKKPVAPRQAKPSPAKRSQVKPKGKPKVKHSQSDKKQMRLEKERIKQRQIERALNDSEPTYFQKQFNRFASLLRFNITFKLTLGYMMRLVFLISLIAVSVYGSFAFYLVYDTQNTLAEKQAYVDSLLIDGYAYDDPLIDRYLNTEGLSLSIFDNEQSLVYTSDERSIAFSDIQTIEDYDILNFPELPTIYQVNHLQLDSQDYNVVLSQSMRDKSDLIRSTFPIVPVMLIVLLISSTLSSNRMSNKTLKPIHIMTEDVKDMSANNLSKRLNVSGTKDELKDLAETFNMMLDDIQKSYEREKQFVSDASHELRTPIAVIKGYAGMLNRWGKDDPDVLEESISAILGETDNMHSLVESLLFIARNDKGTLKMDMAHFDFSQLMQEIVKETHLIDSDHTIEESIDENVKQYGSVDKLKQAIRVFIDNSIKYTPDGGQLKIRLQVTDHENIITISDNGIGISKEDLPHIFDRFYRADKSRTKLKNNQHGGTGLGLSIAKIIIEQHGGHIRVISDLNKGTQFTLTLPHAFTAAHQK